MLQTRILSTKILSTTQRDRIIELGCSYTERNFIDIKKVPFQYKESGQTFLFSSQNAVKFVFLQPNMHFILKNKPCYCVGEKTKTALEKNGLKVVHYEENSTKLGDFIVKNNQNERFLFFCGKERKSDLEDKLSSTQISLEITEVYNTILKPKFVGNFDVVLFYSPSGVRSFIQNNTLSNTICICIGYTTAKTILLPKEQIKIASRPTIEHMIYQLKKHIRAND